MHARQDSAALDSCQRHQCTCLRTCNVHGAWPEGAQVHSKDSQDMHPKVWAPANDAIGSNRHPQTSS
jgi:hypothetical protein